MNFFTKLFSRNKNTSNNTELRDNKSILEQKGNPGDLRIIREDTMSPTGEIAFTKWKVQQYSDPWRKGEYFWFTLSVSSSLEKANDCLKLFILPKKQTLVMSASSESIQK